MSSGFVSAGGEEIKPREGLSEYDKDAWEKARQKIEELKKPKPEAPGTQEGGLSLYEHLQAQKAAKQEAFEEATKVRNQFRPLDDSEVAFLESIKQKEQSEADKVRKETEEQLAAFRREREAAEEKARELEASQATREGSGEVTQDTWTTTKKRRRAKDDDKSGIPKSLKTSTSKEEAHPSSTTQVGAQPPAKPGVEKPKSPVHSLETATKAISQTASKPAASLVTYDSESD